MKLQKEEIQKIVLGALLGLGVIYGYFDMLLFPIQKRHTGVLNSISALDPEIEKASAQVKKAEEMEANAPKAKATIAEIDALIPEGAPVAWFPVVVGDNFKKAGVDKAITRLSNEMPDKILTGYKRISWGIEVPKVDCMTFGAALAEFENAEPLTEVQAITIETQREEAEAQRVVLVVNNIVKQ